MSGWLPLQARNTCTCFRGMFAQRVQTQVCVTVEQGLLNISLVFKDFAQPVMGLCEAGIEIQRTGVFPLRSIISLVAGRTDAVSRYSQTHFWGRG